MIILAVAALIVVMMAAVPAVAQSEDELEKCEDAQQELAQAQKSGDEKEIEKATRKVAEKCPPLPPP